MPLTFLLLFSFFLLASIGMLQAHVSKRQADNSTSSFKWYCPGYREKGVDSLPSIQYHSHHQWEGGGGSRQEKCHGWKRKQCHLLPGHMAVCAGLESGLQSGWAPGESHCRSRCPTAAAITTERERERAPAPALLPSPWPQREGACAGTATTTGVSTLAAQLLIHTKLSFQPLSCPCFPLFQVQGGGLAVGASRQAAFVFLGVEWGDASGWSPFCLCLEIAPSTAHGYVQW